MDVLIEIEGGDHHNWQGVGDVGAGESTGGFDAVHQRHSDVEQANFRAQLERQAYCLAPVSGRADHLDVGVGRRAASPDPCGRWAGHRR
jgi:hypothetical protein